MARLASHHLSGAETALRIAVMIPCPSRHGAEFCQRPETTLPPYQYAVYLASPPGEIAGRWWRTQFGGCVLRALNAANPPTEGYGNGRRELARWGAMLQVAASNHPLCQAGTGKLKTTW